MSQPSVCVKFPENLGNFFSQIPYEALWTNCRNWLFPCKNLKNPPATWNNACFTTKWAYSWHKIPCKSCCFTGCTDTKPTRRESLHFHWTTLGNAGGAVHFRILECVPLFLSSPYNICCTADPNRKREVSICSAAVTDPEEAQLLDYSTLLTFLFACWPEKLRQTLNQAVRRCPGTAEKQVSRNRD